MGQWLSERLAQPFLVDRGSGAERILARAIGACSFTRVVL
jgi:hypothetical protein